MDTQERGRLVYEATEVVRDYLVDQMGEKAVEQPCGRKITATPWPEAKRHLVKGPWPAIPVLYLVGQAYQDRAAVEVTVGEVTVLVVETWAAAHLRWGDAQTKSADRRKVLDDSTLV